MSAQTLPVAKFRCGHVVTTPNALSQLTEADILRGIQRHQAGDWGDADEELCRENELSLKTIGRIFSVYHAEDGTKFWIITEADRAATTILLPQDY